jgi:cysteine desulfurase
MTDPIYLDHNATTPIAPQVLEAMLPWLRSEYGNPSSNHPPGRRAAQAIATARWQVAELIGARPDEIVFTGCATEANNLALLGVARALGTLHRHLVVSAIEHPAVMAPAQHLRDQGWTLTVLPVNALGRTSPDQLASALRPDTAFVLSCMRTTRWARCSRSPRSPRSRARVASCCTQTPRSRSASFPSVSTHWV